MSVVITITPSTLADLQALRLPGESWDAALRRWAGLPAKVKPPKAEPKPKGLPGAPWGKWGYVNAGIRALKPGEWVTFPWLGQRDSAGAMPSQIGLMNAVTRVIAAIQLESPGTEFYKRDLGSKYQIYMRDPNIGPKYALGIKEGIDQMRDQAAARQDHPNNYKLHPDKPLT